MPALTKGRPRRRTVRATAAAWAGAVLAAGLACPSALAAPIPEALPKGGAACFAGDAGCRNDAFTIAAALMAADNVVHVVMGRVVDALGLPETLGERRVVSARFEVRRVRKPPGRCSGLARRESREERCHSISPLPRFLTLRIPSDWFAWPATGTSRRVARRAGPHLAALAKLDGDLASRLIAEPEYAERKARLEGLVRQALAAGETGERPPGLGVVRLLEDRRMRVEIDVEYLFALGAERRDEDGPYYLPATPQTDADADWHFFAGDEFDDVDVGLRGIGNCLLVYREWFAEQPTVPDCAIFARGMASYWPRNPHLRRH